MNEALQRQIAESESKLSLLLREIRDTDIAPRVQLWIGKMCGGRKLSDWLHDEKVPDKDKLTVTRSLIDILLTKSFERLPEVPAEPAPGATLPRATVQPNPVAEHEMPAPDELRAMIQQEVRTQLAGLLEMVAHAIREAK